ncbi:MAG: diguanylate cyclase [Paucimonas sp.]|nr:diguanylate cyclase [Paucimonas sp.]
MHPLSAYGTRGFLVAWLARNSPALAAVLVGVLGLLFTAALFHWVRAWETSVVQGNFQRQAEAAAGSIEKSLAATRDDLTLLRDFFQAQNSEVSRWEFRLFTAPMLRRAPFVKGLAWQRILPDADRATFEKERARDFPGFRIKALHEGQVRIAPQRRQYRIIDYVEPAEIHKSSIGHDVQDIGPVTAGTALLAQRTGQATVTPLMMLPFTKQYGFLVYMPVYSQGGSGEAVAGLVVAIFAVGESVRTTMTSADAGSDLELVLYNKDADGWVAAYSTPPSARKRYQPLPFSSLLYASADLKYVKDFSLLNSEWEIRIASPRPSPMEEHIGSLLTLVAGLIGTLSLAVYTFVLGDMSRRVRLLVAQRTEQLDRANRRLKEDVGAREAHNRILHMIATGSPLVATLDEILLFAAGRLCAARCLVLMFDGTVRAPHLPETLVAAIAARSADFSTLLWSENGKLLNAIKPNQPQLDQATRKWCELLADSGMRSVAAWAIASKTGDVLGSFVVFTEAPGMARQVDAGIIDTCTHLVSIMIDSRRVEDRVRHMAHHDELTGLPNRLLFGEYLHQAIGRAQRSQRPVAVMFLDLDRFKNVNDSFGHNIGDGVLCALARNFRSCLRDPDTIARIGGDEFVLMLEDYGDVSHVGEVAQRLVREASAPIEIAGHKCHLGVSIGIATFPADGNDAGTLMKNADTAMYRAKALGRSNYQFYSAEMNVHTLNRIALESGLRQALDRHEIVVHYQPKISIASGRVIGVEALVRWQHVDQGLILPADFVPFAEEIGLISLIGMRVLRSACADIACFRQAGVDVGRVAINLSGIQFNDSHLVSQVRNVIAAAGVDPTVLEFEITESMVMQNRERAIELMQGIRELGIHLAIDDFGTGYSSLASLKRFPVDSVKIDRSFIVDIPNDENGVGIVRAIIAMAHTLDLKVVAEGVETVSQLEVLRKFGCDSYQGYFFSGAMSANDLIALLGKRAVPALPALPEGQVEGPLER